MIIRLGYACISKTLEITSSHTITYTNYDKLKNEYNIEVANEKLTEIINNNLDNLQEILKYNINNNIHFYRMSSSIIPLATHPKIEYNALEVFKNKLENIGRIINDNNLRVDIHLDQFCVLNSTNSQIVKSTINIINFYKNMLKIMRLKTYMVIHVGSGTFGKKNSIIRFINNFKKLDTESKKMIIIENDDKIFNVKDTLYICKKLDIPMVLDYHHHICNHEEETDKYMADIFNTWKKDIPKIHFSSPKNKKEFRSHHDYIDVNDFIDFLDKMKNVNRDFDIMLEAKEKDFALFKLVRLLKYKNYKFIDDTTIEI